MDVCKGYEMIKAYLYSIDPLDSADGKWDYGLLKQTFDRNHIEQLTVKQIPNEERAFVVIPGQGNAGKEDRISEQLKNLGRVVLFITGDEGAHFNVDKISHPNIEIWVQYPHQKHEKYNKVFIGAPQHIKDNLPNYPIKEYDVYFGGQITHQRRKQLGEAMPGLSNSLYKPTPGFAQGDTPKDYYATMSKAKIAPCPAGAQVVDTFRFFESIEMLCLPVGDLVDSKGIEKDFFAYVGAEDIPITKTNNWHNLKEMVPNLLNDYPNNMHKVVSWWIKYKRDFSIKIMRQVNE
jgi:hypothetical protein